MNTHERIPAALVNVTRSALGDGTNGGISTTADQLAVVGIIRGRDNKFVRIQPAHCDGNGYLPNGETPSPTPCVALWAGHVLGLPSAHLVPVDYGAEASTFTPTPGHHMAGGNWGIGSPALARVVNFLLAEPILGHFNAALPIHDRTE